MEYALDSQVSHDNAIVQRQRLSNVHSKEYSHKDNPRHLLALVILCNKVSREDAREQLEERRVYLQDGEEEEYRNRQAEQMTEVWL